MKEKEGNEKRRRDRGNERRIEEEVETVGEVGMMEVNAGTHLYHNTV